MTGEVAVRGRGSDPKGNSDFAANKRTVAVDGDAREGLFDEGVAQVSVVIGRARAWHVWMLTA